MSRLPIALLALFSTVPGSAFYTTDGDLIVDRTTRETVILRGFGLGGWLLPEGYMWGESPMKAPRDFEAAIVDLIGEEDAAEFWRLYYKNFVVEEDFAAMKAWGCNSVRIPILANVLQPRELQPEEPPFVYNEEGFALLDNIVAWCTKYRIGVIWDMHGAPGAQNYENISDSDGSARLWLEPEKYWPRLIDLWARIAERYGDEPCVAGYDLLNEPLLATSDAIPNRYLREIYLILTGTIRAFDPDGILFLEGDWWARDYALIEPIDWDEHLAIGFHSYPPPQDDKGLKPFLKLREKYGTPLWLGETGEQWPPYDLIRNGMRTLERHGVGWNWWTHKKFERDTQPFRIVRTDGFNRILAYWRGLGPRPSRDDAKAWLFEQARLVDTRYCQFLPEIVEALEPLNPDGYLSGLEKFSPEIIRSTRGQSIREGGFAEFEAVAVGNGLSYEWMIDSEKVPDATGSILELRGVERRMDGSKVVARVSNGAGSVESEVAELRVAAYDGPALGPVPQPPRIDGIVDDIWSAIAPTPLSTVTVGEPPSSEDLSASFRAAYDQDAVYLLIEVVDDVKFNETDNLYKNDCIELYIDPQNDLPRVWGEDEFMMRVMRDRPDFHLERGRLEEMPRVGQRETAHGYVIELAISWDSIRSDPTASPFIGFDLHVNDADGTDGKHRENKVAWFGKEDRAFRTPTALGALRVTDQN